MSERKLKYSKFGLTENPIGLYVCLPWKDGRTLLGEVRSFRCDQVTGGIRLTVRYFCGDPWPIEPMASAVKVIEAEGTASLVKGSDEWFELRNAADDERDAEDKAEGTVKP